MIKTVCINTIEDVTRIFLDNEFSSDIGRMRSNYLFRGIPSKDYQLTTSLQRNCKDKASSLEYSILRYFTKYGIMSDSTISDSVWRQMIMGQHHGLPTRLLDWSHSSLIALHFATAELNFEDTDKRDGIVWRIDANELSDLLPNEYQEALKKERTEVFSVDTLDSVVSSLEKYDKDMGDSAMALVEPPSTDQRIINQYSYFSIIPMGMTDIESFLDKYTEKTVRYIISKDIRWEVRDILDQSNISERIVFPGLDGLSKWIARHYYVK